MAWQSAKITYKTLTAIKELLLLIIPQGGDTLLVRVPDITQRCYPELNSRGQQCTTWFHKGQAFLIVVQTDWTCSVAPSAKLFCMFETTYLCEQVFSVINKSKLHSRLTHKHFNTILKWTVTQNEMFCAFVKPSFRSKLNSVQLRLFKDCFIKCKHFYNVLLCTKTKGKMWSCHYLLVIIKLFYRSSPLDITLSCMWPLN